MDCILNKLLTAVFLVLSVSATAKRRPWLHSRRLLMDDAEQQQQWVDALRRRVDRTERVG